MKEEMLLAFQREITTLKRLVDGYLATNPLLNTLELKSLQLKETDGPKEPAETDEPGAELKFMAAGLAPPRAYRPAHPDQCRICKDSHGNPMCCYDND